MKWTRKMPREPGRYWAAVVRTDERRIAGPFTIALTRDGDPFCIERQESLWARWGGYWWPERIQEPPAPTPENVEPDNCRFCGRDLSEDQPGDYPQECTKHEGNCAP